MFNITAFPRPSTYVDSYNLAAATAETITKPAGYTLCNFVADADCWIRRGGTAVAGVADVVDGTASIYIPAKTNRIIDWSNDAPTAALATLSIISTAGGNASLEWFK